MSQIFKCYAVIAIWEKATQILLIGGRRLLVVVLCQIEKERMNPETHRHGCHDRKPFAKTISSISGYIPEGTERPSWPNVMSMDCEYTKTALGQSDRSCAGCKWQGEAAALARVWDRIDAALKSNV